MNLYVFGAGASQGALSNLDPRLVPPLSDQIFDEQYRDYGDEILFDRSLASHCKEESKKAGSTEKWLTEKWDKISTINSEVKKRTEKSFFGHLTFYLWRILQQVSTTSLENNYDLLLEKITSSEKDEDFAFISFNYDTLLDKAISRHCKTSLTNIYRYKRVNYIKPHGSVNWFLPSRSVDPLYRVSNQYDELPAIRLAAEHMFNGDNLDLNGVEVFDPTHVNLNSYTSICRSFGSQYCYPLVLAPLLSKLYPFINNLQNEIIDEGKTLFAKASDIYLIGYKAADEIIFEMMSTITTPTKLHFVGRSFDSVNEIIERVSKKTNNPNILVGNTYVEGFENFVNNFKP